jgi:hypothetical protein
MFKSRASQFIFITLLLFTFTVQAAPLTSTEKLSDLNQLVAQMKAGYGPLQYKNEVLHINIDRLAQKYRDRVSATQTNGDFYYLLVQFVAEFKDSHFSASLPTTQVASLPFTTDLVEGKVLIDRILPSFFHTPVFPFERGDEVVALNGQPISKVLDQISTYFGSGFELTTRRRAAMSVPFRPGATMPVPKGSVKVSVLKQGALSPDEVTLNWDVQGEAVDENGLNLKLGKFLKTTMPPRDFDDISIADLWADFKGFQAEKSFRCSGGTRTAIPSDATIIMKDPFVAYYHPTPKGNVGYLRIPHYSPMNALGQPDYALRFSQYEYAVSILEKNTVGLIIDQDHNCGGSVAFLHNIISLFMDKDFQPIQFQLLANKQEYLQFQGWANSVDKNTLEYQGFQRTFELVKAAWATGQFMTPKTAIDGTVAFPPNHIHYTKPIVMLIDEMSGSGGDAFPALMKGFGRAKLLGTRTMGAGGHVVVQPALYFSQVGSRMTKSLFYRPDGVPVENNGAVPDIPYTITRDDFVHEYKGYQAFYVSKLLELVP